MEEGDREEEYKSKINRNKPVNIQKKANHTYYTTTVSNLSREREKNVSRMTTTILKILLREGIHKMMLLKIK